MKSFKNSRRYLFFFIIIGILILLIWNPVGFSTGARSVLFKISYPFQKSFYFLGSNLKRFKETLNSISSLSQENEALLKENSKLNRNLALLQSVQKENEELRKQLDLAPWKKFDLAAALVIGRSSMGSGNWILIDKGSQDGLTKGMPVIVYEGILVGKINEVYADSAQVRLISDSDSVINVKDVATGARGLVRGEHGLGIFLDMVEQRESINQGDFLVTSGLGENLPDNLLIGKIQDMVNSSGNLFQQAIVSPQVKYSDLSSVLIIKGQL